MALLKRGTTFARFSHSATMGSFGQRLAEEAISEWFCSESDPNWESYYAQITSPREMNRFMAQCYRLASACNFKRLHIPPPPHRPTGQPYVVEQCVSADSYVAPEEESVPGEPLIPIYNDL